MPREESERPRGFDTEVPKSDHASVLDSKENSPYIAKLYRQKHWTTATTTATMTTLKITAKGQVTLRQSLLRHLGVEPGQKVRVDELPNGKLVVSAARREGAISDFVGCLSRQRVQPLTIDEINEIAAQGWTDES